MLLSVLSNLLEYRYKNSYLLLAMCLDALQMYLQMAHF